MIIIFIFAILFASGIALFVIRPLVDARLISDYSASHVGFADKEELQSVLELREEILRKIIFNTTSNEQIAALSKQSAFDALLSLCLRLQRAELPILPQSISKIANLLVIIVLSASVVMCPNIFAQAAHGAGTDSNGQHSQASMPGLVEKEGSFFPQLSQFVLSPRQGELGVYYLCIFANPTGVSEVILSLPFPQNLSNLNFANVKNAEVLPADGKSWPRIKIPVTGKHTEFRAEFSLPASFGIAEFKNETIPAMPGTTIILMPEYESAMRAILERMIPTLNLWPARVVGTNGSESSPLKILGFKNTREQDKVEASDPNYEMFQKMPPQFNRTFVRQSAQEALPYPTFKVVGVVPSRTPLIALGSLFGSLLFGVAAHTLWNARNKKSS